LICKQPIFGRIGLVVAMAVAISLGTAAVEPQTAEAQMTLDQVEPGFKGVIGLGIVGAELGFILPAAAGLHETWAFIVFPVVGAAGGAVGGYFALEDTGQTELSVASLAFGMAMIVPTMVITLSATAYDPGDEGVVEDGDEELSGEFEEGVGVEGETETEVVGPEADSAVRSREVARAGTGLLRYSGERLMLGVPGLTVARTYTDEEVQRFGVEQRTELRVPLFTGAF